MNKAFSDSTYLGYTYHITTTPEGFKTAEIRRKSDDSMLKFYKNLLSYDQAEGMATAFIDGITHTKEMYICPECGYTASVDEIARTRKRCCIEGKPIC